MIDKVKGDLKKVENKYNPSYDYEDYDKKRNEVYQQCFNDLLKKEGVSVDMDMIESAGWDMIKYKFTVSYYPKDKKNR